MDQSKENPPAETTATTARRSAAEKQPKGGSSAAEVPAKEKVLAEALNHPFQMKRRFTREGVDPYQEFTYEPRSCKIVNTDGSVVFSLENAEVPQDWSQLASDIIISKKCHK